MPPGPSEGFPLNVEHEEKKMYTPEMQTQPAKLQEKSDVEVAKEKFKKPIIRTSLLLVLMLINFLMLLFGIATIKDCPKRGIIPVYLIVAGTIGIKGKIIPLVAGNRRIFIVDLSMCALFLLEFIWTGFGSYWIYGSYGTDNCGETAYLMAFWLHTLNYVILFFGLMIPCCVICCVAITSKS